MISSNRKETNHTKLTKPIKRIASSFIMMVLILCSIGLFCKAYFGSLSAAIEYARGERLLVTRRIQALGKHSTNTEFDFSFSITNLTGRAVRLLGVKTSCSCAVMGDLGDTLAPNKRRIIPVRMKTPKQPGKVNGSIYIFTDHPDFGSIALGYTVDIIQQGNSSKSLYQ